MKTRPSIIMWRWIGRILAVIFLIFGNIVIFAYPESSTGIIAIIKLITLLVDLVLGGGLALFIVFLIVEGGKELISSLNERIDSWYYAKQTQKAHNETVNKKVDNFMSLLNFKKK